MQDSIMVSISGGNHEAFASAASPFLESQEVPEEDEVTGDCDWSDDDLGNYDEADNSYTGFE